jgi:hypothetical protein
VSPGEYIDGQVDGVNVYHFQDDAVAGDLRFLPFAQPTPIVFQTNMSPTFYVDGADGPGPNGAIPGIGSHSKDLAFEIYAVNIPEPATALLLLTATFGLALPRRRC